MADKSTTSDMATRPSSADLIRPMEQQLGAETITTLPTSSEAKADLAPSLSSSEDGKAPVAAVPSLPLVVELPSAESKPSLIKLSLRLGRDGGVAVTGSSEKVRAVVKEGQLGAEITTTLPTSSKAKADLAPSPSSSGDGKAPVAAVPSLPLVVGLPSAESKLSLIKPPPGLGRDWGVTVTGSSEKVCAVVKDGPFAKGNGEKSSVAKTKKKSKRRYRLKTLCMRSSEAEKSEPQDKMADKAMTSNMATTPSSADLLRSMEQQLRAGITPTLPTSSEARADLARSLSLSEDGKASAATVPSSLPLVVERPSAESRPSSNKSPKVSKKRVRPLGGGGNRGAAVAGSGEKVWAVVTEWQFAEGRGKKHNVKKPPFFKELWMMMAAFGDPRGLIVCKCEARGKRRCICMEGVVVMEALVKSFGTRVVTVCREWSTPQHFKPKHLRYAMPGEMREYLAWRKAHSGRKNSAEKHAGIRLDEDDVDDDDDEDPTGDSEETGVDETGVAKGGEGKAIEKRGYSDGENDGEQEWAEEEEEVAARIEHRRRFADEVTLDMPEEEYLRTFSEYRKAFFLVGRGVKGKSTPGSTIYLAEYIGIGEECPERKDKKLLQALAYMMYDFVGVVVETAIRKRTGGRLVSIALEPMLSAEEITEAAAAIPPIPGRAQRMRVRSVRAANPDGISRNKPLAGFPVGLEYRGDPLRWLRNKIEKGRVLVEGGQVVNACDKRLAEEAMEILETDFADC